MNKQINYRVFEKFPEIESNRLYFREFNVDDAPDLFEIRSSQEIMKYMDSYVHQNIQDTYELIESVHKSFKEKKGINWAIIEKSSKQLIGYFGYWRLIPEHCRAEIGYALKTECWGKGYMKETLNKLVHFGFKDLQLHSIEANCNPKNINSIRLLTNFGFKQEANFRENYYYNGQFIDSMIFCLLESDV